MPSAGRPITIMKPAKPMAPPIAIQACVHCPPKLASTTARMHQAAASSTAPAVSARVPSGVPAMPRSWMIRASMGKAVMEMAAPRNSPASLNRDWPAKRAGRCISHGAIAKARPNGTAMPATEISSALRYCVRKWSLRNSVPTRNM